MFDASQVLQLVQQRTNPTNWDVVPAKQSHFLQVLFGGIILAVLGIAAAVFLALDPSFVLGLRVLVDVDSLYLVWRIVDFVFCAFIVLAGAGLIRSAIMGISTQDQQMLVLMPEGFVMQKGTSSKTISAIAYANVNSPKVVIQRGVTYLMMARVNGQGALRLELDGRFGPPKQIAKRIIEAHQLYTRAQAPR